VGEPGSEAPVVPTECSGVQQIRPSVTVGVERAEPGVVVLDSRTSSARPPDALPDHAARCRGHDRHVESTVRVLGDVGERVASVCHPIARQEASLRQLDVRVGEDLSGPVEGGARTHHETHTDTEVVPVAGGAVEQVSLAVAIVVSAEEERVVVANT